MVVPAGALQTLTAIAVSRTGDGAPPLPDGTVTFGPMFAFTPHGTSFALPATLTVPFDPSTVPAGTTPVLLKTTAGQSGWEVVSDASVEGGQMSARVGSFSYAVVAAPPKLFFYGPIRFWQFFVDESRGENVPVDPVKTQDDFTVVSDRQDLGTLPIAPPGRDETARTEVFSSASGATFWALAQAPHLDDLSVQAGLIGSESELRTSFLFIKQAADASFRLVVSKAVLELMDGNPGDPTWAQCPWSPALDPQDCERVMKARVNFEVTLDDITLNKGWAIAGGYARLTGWFDHWHILAESAGVGRGIWDEDSFDLAVSPGAVTASLNRSIVVDVPLDHVGLGHVFSVKVSLDVAATNHRQGESYVGAFFRDPAQADGVVVQTTGVEPASPTLLVDVPREPGVAGECPGGTTNGGTIEFSAPEFREPESTGSRGAWITVRRASGSQGEASVLVTSRDGTATAGSDYAATSSVVHFADGEAGQRIVPVPLVVDDLEEPDETVLLSLSDPRGCAQLGAQRTATLTILDDDHPPPSVASFTVGGTVRGLVGAGLVLRDVLSGESLSPGADGPFTFSRPHLDRTGYDVRVDAQPTNPLQNCTVANGKGTLAGANVTTVAVTCSTPLPPGGLDPSFGDQGRAVTGVPFSANLLGARIGMALQGDGKILLVGGLTLIRLNTDGTLDRTFGTQGVATVEFERGAEDTAMDVAVQADGKIVVAGTTATSVVGSDDFALTRFNPDGSLDTTFGNQGHVTTDFFGSTDQVRRMRLQDDGRILVVGYAVRVVSPTVSAIDFAIARYGADGAPDLTFSTDGRTTDSPGNVFSMANGLAVQSDGKIVVAGSTAPNGVDAPDTGLVRYLGDGQVQLPGTRDDGFGPMSNGTVEGLFGGFDQAVDVVILDDGSILAAADVSLGGTFGFGLMHVPSNGIPPPRLPQPFVTFTTDNDKPRAMLKQADGKIVVVGQAANFVSNADMAIARFDATGFSLDPSFGNGGKLTIDFFGARDDAYAVVQQVDGKLVVGGFARSGAGNVFAAVRVAP